MILRLIFPKHGLFNTLLVWLRVGGVSEWLEADGVPIVTLPYPKMQVDAPVSEFMQVADALLNSERPDILHFHTFD
jgi:hypothetical protein